MIKTDSAFYIGTTHNVCEDYAVNGDNYIIISDGCSSSKNTDIGARLLCEYCKQHNCYKNLQSDLFPSVSIIINSVGLSDYSLAVTFLSAYVENNKIIINTIGDGNIIIKTKDGIIHIISMNYSKSAPYYINYYLNKEDNKLWEKIIDNKYIVEYTKIENMGKTNGEDDYFIETSKSLNNDFTSFFIPNCDFSFSPKINKLALNIEDIEWVALSSDGLNSFYEQIITETSKYNKPIWYIDIIIELLKIKNTNGRFVQRRLNKFRKNCIKKNWYYADDISLAVLYIGDTNGC